jgi:hypothetical protein
MTFPWFVRAHGDALFPLQRVRYADYARREAPVPQTLGEWVVRDPRPLDPDTAASAALVQAGLAEGLQQLRDATTPGSPLDFGHEVAP